MLDLVYKEGLATDDFLALAQRVWPRNYIVDEATAALSRLRAESNFAALTPPTSRRSDNR